MTWDVTSTNHLSARAGYMPRWLLWINARNRDTDAIVGFGISNLDDHATFPTLSSRLYYGAQGAFSVGVLRYTADLTIQTCEVTLSGVSPESQQLVRGYDVRLAKFELHCALFDPLSATLIGIERMMKGTVDAAPITTPAVNGISSIKLDLVSSLRAMTRTIPRYKSHEAQKQRSGDMFRQYASVAAQVDTLWGEK